VASSPSREQQKTGALGGFRFFFAPDFFQPEQAWKVWWLWGPPLAWLTTVLILGAEEFRLNGMPVAGNLLDVLRLAVYWFWCRLAWRCAGNAGNPLWTLLTRAALAAGLVATVLT
jgi:hypothetical protein